MTYHILNGDALTPTFAEAEIEGAIIVMREALIDGDLSGDSLKDFWQTRARHIGISLDDYYNTSVKEFNKIMNIPHDAEINLWFEYDLFCQVNMWFVLSLINQLNINPKVFAVYTTHLSKGDQHFWNGFGPATPEDLTTCYANKVQFRNREIELGHDLWKAYKTQDFETLNALSKEQSPAFPYLQEVIQAHIDRFPQNGQKGRPERVIEDILKNTPPEFYKVFKEFQQRQSIYGFGDTQLKKIYDEVVQQ